MGLHTSADPALKGSRARDWQLTCEPRDLKVSPKNGSSSAEGKVKIKPQQKGFVAIGT